MIPKQNYNVLNLSGASTKIVLQYSILEEMNKQKPLTDTYNLITGISAGSILGLPIAMGMFNPSHSSYKKLNDLLHNFTLDTFFKQKPITPKGKLSISAYWNIVTGKPFLGDQSKLIDVLKSIISEKEFNDWRKTSSIQVVVGSTDFQTGSQSMIVLNKLTYDKAMQAILASSSIPIFTKAVEVDFSEALLEQRNITSTNYKPYYFDGGVRDHIASATVLEYLLDTKNKVTNFTSIFSRPKNYNTTTTEYKQDSIMDVLMRTIDIMNIEISKTDEKLADEMCAKFTIPQIKYYVPHISNNTYEVDKIVLMKHYDHVKEQVNKK